MAEENKMPDWLQMVRDACTPEIWAKIIEQQAEKAMNGDAKALDFFASCVLPKERGVQGADVVKTVRIVLSLPEPAVDTSSEDNGKS